MNRARQFKVSVQQQEPISPHLYCTICREIFYKPLRVACGHTFCGSCILKWIQIKRTCPECRYEINRNFIQDKDLLAEVLVQNIQIECIKCNNWEGEFQSFKNHQKECQSQNQELQFSEQFLKTNGYDELIEISDTNESNCEISIEVESAQMDIQQKQNKEDDRICVDITLNEYQYEIKLGN